jgi:glycosyltransferase involved in cell wall biosynthesis
MASELAILVPVLRRPANVAPLMESVALATSVPYRLLFVASPGDDEEIRELTRCGADFITLTRPPGPGDYARKINAGFHATSEPFLFSGADDLRFHPGWFEAARGLMTGAVEVVGTNDLGNPRTIAGEHSTHTLFTRHYIETAGGVVDASPGVVLNEAYPHSYVDDEFVQTAMSRGVYAHALDSHVEHLHWLWGKGDTDSVYALGAAGHRVGRRLYARRSRLWRPA